jgi:Cysteine rich repeat
MRTLFAVALMTTFSILASDISASAQAHMGTPQEQKACNRDASRFCRKDLGNDGAVQSCLQANRAKLSSACRKVFESHGM